MHTQPTQRSSSPALISLALAVLITLLGWFSQLSHGTFSLGLTSVLGTLIAVGVLWLVLWLVLRLVLKH